MVAAIWSAAPVTNSTASLCSDVFEYNFQMRKTLGDGDQHPVHKDFFLVEYVHFRIGHLAVHQQRHADLFHCFKRPVAPGNIGDPCGGIRGGAGRIIFHPMYYATFSPRQFLKGECYR